MDSYLTATHHFDASCDGFSFGVLLLMLLTGLLSHQVNPGTHFFLIICQRTSFFAVLNRFHSSVGLAFESFRTLRGFAHLVLYQVYLRCASCDI